MTIRSIAPTPNAGARTAAAQRRGSDARVTVAKHPAPGNVQPRLGATIGHERAATLYTAFLRDLSERFTAGERVGGYHLRWACVDDAPDGAQLRKLRALLGANAMGALNATGAMLVAGKPHQPRVFAQRGAELAERLYNVCAEMRAAGYRRIVILSSDSPHAPLAVVRRAFALLATHDVALGPAMDGGYYLIGLRLDGAHHKPAANSSDDNSSDDTSNQNKHEDSDHVVTPFPDLFLGVGMSEPTTLRQTLARAEQLRLTVASLPTTFDVDEAPDLARLADHLRLYGAPLAPHTAAALAGLTLPN